MVYIVGQAGAVQSVVVATKIKHRVHEQDDEISNRMCKRYVICGCTHTGCMTRRACLPTQNASSSIPLNFISITIYIHVHVCITHRKYMYIVHVYNVSVHMYTYMYVGPSSHVQ